MPYLAARINDLSVAHIHEIIVALMNFMVVFLAPHVFFFFKHLACVQSAETLSNASAIAGLAR